MLKLQMIRDHVSASGAPHRAGDLVSLPEALAAHYIALGVARPIAPAVREAVDDDAAGARKAVRRGERP